MHEVPELGQQDPSRGKRQACAQHGEGGDQCVGLARNRRALFEPPTEGSRSSEQDEGRDRDCAVKRREGVPAAEPDHRGHAPGKAESDAANGQARPPQMALSHFPECAPPLTRTPQAEPRPQSQNRATNRRAHPNRMEVGENPRPSFVAGGIQSLHPVHGALGKASEKRVEGALQIACVARLEGQHHLEVLDSDARI